MIRLRLKKLTAWLLALTIVTGCLPVASVFAEEQADVTALPAQAEVDQADYAAYLTSTSGVAPAAQEILLLDGQKSCSVGDTLDFTVSVPADGCYRLNVTYRNTVKRSTVLAFTADGAYPFTEAEQIELPTYWENGTAGRTDNMGNEFTPEQVISPEWITMDCRDYAGKYTPAYRFALTAGTHTLSLRVADGTVECQRIALTPAVDAPAYDAKSVTGGDTDEVITVEGEDAWLKSSISLIPLSDDSSADVSPADPSVSKLNYVGGTNWSAQNDTLVWKVKVEKAGYYALGFSYRQSGLIGGVSYRRLMVDGVSPFAEAEKVKFKYGTSWEYTRLEDENDEPLWLYFDEGEHTLSLAVTAGELADVYKQLQDTTIGMGNLYVDITMVVGETVDVSRSYELFNQIPQFNERLAAFIESLESIADRMEVLQEKKSGSNVSILRNAIETMRKMHDRPYSSHKYKDEFYSGYTNISSLMGSLTQMPLDIDRIFLIGKSADFDEPGASFFKKTAFSVNRFWNSFVNDYRVKKPSESGQQPLNIWVAWGRDQVQLLDALIQSDFVAKQDIPVNLKLVNASHIQALLSKNGPDIMLQMPHTEPVNLAMRGGLIDLEQFDDFEEVTKRFTHNGTLSFEYRNGTYALPDTLTYDLMFVRTDILEEMGLQPPKTWQDFIYATTILQHSNLQVALPGNTLYSTMLLQNGLDLYNEERTACTLTGEDHIQVMKEWTDLYTRYKVPVTVSFYNRFRIGSIPLGIAPHTTYLELEATAPEIAGRWEALPIPGVEKADGSIDITCAGSGTGCAITKLSKNPQNAWEFLKWWTDADTQLKFSNSLESVLGSLGRVSSATVDALLKMDWSDQMVSTMKTQLASVEQIPELPGSYYLTRGVEQVFWNVVEQNANVTDTMLEWGAIVDGEIARKMREYANR